MSETSVGDTAYVEQVGKIENQLGRGRISYKSTEKRLLFKTTIFSRLPAFKSGSRPKLLWEKLKENVVGI